MPGTNLMLTQSPPSTSAGPTSRSTAVHPSLNWARAMPPGPDTRVKITEAYAALVARDVYFWAWPMVNVYNRRLYFSKVTQQQYTGPSPQAPVNRFTMLADYAPPEQRNVACANQD